MSILLKKMKRIYLLILGTIVLFEFYGCGRSGAMNYKTAYISEYNSRFIITVKGKRLLHPASLFDIGKTYEDSQQYQIPRNKGIVKGEELPWDSGYYKATGSIIIDSSYLKIDLYYINTDDKKLDTGSWNGEYDLVKIK
jgi:hypothetical protein